MPEGQESSQTSPEQLQTSPAQPKPSPAQLQTSPEQFQTSPAQPQTLTWLLPHTWMRDPAWERRRAGGAWGQQSPEGDTGRSQKGPLPLPFISAVDKKKRNTFPAWMFFPGVRGPSQATPVAMATGRRNRWAWQPNPPSRQMLRATCLGDSEVTPLAPLPSSSCRGEALVAPRGVLAGRRDTAPRPRGLNRLRSTWARLAVGKSTFSQTSGASLCPPPANLTPKPGHCTTGWAQGTEFPSLQ